jgi:hypothetical protein
MGSARKKATAFGGTRETHGILREAFTYHENNVTPQDDHSPPEVV